MWSPRPDSFHVHPKQLAKKSDPETSHEAAEALDTDAQIWTVLQAIRSIAGARSLGGPGIVGDQLQVLFGIEDQREHKVAYSSVLGHIVTLERQCYVERPGIKVPGERFGKNQLVIWALTHQEREERLAILRSGLENLPDQETLALLYEWYPLQKQLDELSQRVTDIKERIFDRYLPDRPLGVWKAPLPSDAESEYTLIMEFKRYSRKLRVKGRKRK
jgi:hypothetical protein